tara:strand:- start:2 stop:418 length:417 start_codon:yes stop_codon:yes gene_type:complete
MAIIGGAGNPVGGSFTGPAEALEYIEDRVYAYSGAVAATNSSTANVTMLKFTTGSKTVACRVQYVDEGIQSYARYLKITLNGATVSLAAWKDVDVTANMPVEGMDLIISPYTEVEVLFNINGTTGNGYALLTGQIIER